MGILQDLTEQLAKDVVDAMDELGDDKLHDRVGRVLLDASPTTQEAFMTAYRVRVSQKRAEKFIAAALAKGPKDPSRGRIELGGKQILNAPDEGAAGGH